ncbi:hypothetical protein H477_2937 [[Clostridium] sordellii ATCC 9714]|nr:hypothetical protein H477_2937 [[Clostridium] sordellii ATCC 9714] [Paeniclostridium sordellii ATCC 9714]
MFKKIEEKYITKASTIKLKVKYISKQEAIREIQESIQGYQVNVEGIEVISDDECIYTLRKSKLVGISEIISILSENKNIIMVTKLDSTS